MLADNKVREQVNIESPEMWESGMLYWSLWGKMCKYETPKNIQSVYWAQYRLMQSNTIVMQWIAPQIREAPILKFWADIEY